MRTVFTSLGTSVLFFLCFSISHAASLRVSPTNLELIAPDSAGIMHLGNEAKQPINIQARIFHWTQINGKERLEETSDVVASPPATTLLPNTSNVIRIIRVSKKPIATEESYRVLLDELPNPTQRRNGTVNMVLRYSVPIFFRSSNATFPKVTWHLSRTRQGSMLIAQNHGDTHLRIADLRITQGKRKITYRPGLVGYVLGRATMHWPLNDTKNISASPIILSAQSAEGPLHARIVRKKH